MSSQELVDYRSDLVAPELAEAPIYFTYQRQHDTRRTCDGCGLQAFGEAIEVLGELIAVFLHTPDHQL